MLYILTVLERPVQCKSNVYSLTSSLTSSLDKLEYKDKSPSFVKFGSGWTKI